MRHTGVAIFMVYLLAGLTWAGWVRRINVRGDAPPQVAILMQAATPTPTKTLTPTTTQTATVTQTTDNTQTLTATSTITGTQTVSPTLTLTPAGSLTPTLTPTLSPTPSLSPTLTPTSQIQPPTITMAKVASATATAPETQTPAVAGTPDIHSATPTLIPFPSVTFQFPEARTTERLLALRHAPEASFLPKQSDPPLWKGLVKLWPLALLVVIWAILAVWLVVSQRLSKP